MKNREKILKLATALADHADSIESDAGHATCEDDLMAILEWIDILRSTSISLRTTIEATLADRQAE